MTEMQDAARFKAAATYDAAADTFDAAPLAFWARTGQRTVHRLALEPGAHVLDAGCGTGASAIPAARVVAPDGRVVGVDLAENMLERARRKAAFERLDNVEFVNADMTALDHPDGAFDAVISVFSVFFVPDMEGVAAEFWRLVKPGGRLAITTWGARAFGPGAGIFHDVCREHCPEHDVATYPWERIDEPTALAEMLMAAGLDNVEIEAESNRQSLSRPEDWWTIIMGTGFRWTVERLDPATRAMVEAANIEAIRARGVDAVETNVIYATARKPS